MLWWIQSQADGVKKQFLLEWASRLQGPQSTSSTESESIEWGRAAKAILRVKEALDAWSETSALRWLRGQQHCAWQCKEARHEARASPSPCRNVFPFAGAASNFAARVGTAENEADIMTKVLSAMRHRELCKTDFDLDAAPEASVMPHAAMSRHAGWRSLGSPEDVFSCPCTTAQLLGKLTGA